MRAVGDVPEPPVSPPVLGAPDRGTAAPAPADGARPFGVEELKTLPLQALLVRSGALTIEQLSEALRVNVATGRNVEEIAVERGWVTAEQVAQLVAAKQAVAPEPVAEAPAPAPIAAAPVQPVQPVQPIQEVQPVQPVQPAPPVQPVQPVQPEPAPQPTAQYAPPAAAPVATPGAAVPMTQTEQPAHGEKSVGVFLNLTDGQRVWVGRFADEAAAEARAQEVIQAFVRPEPGVWPRFGGRFVRPEAVVSVELSKRRDD
jgi:outer membrane biosynthesis protein TonB